MRSEIGKIKVVSASSSSSLGDTHPGSDAPSQVSHDSIFPRAQSGTTGANGRSGTSDPRTTCGDRQKNAIILILVLRKLNPSLPLWMRYLKRLLAVALVFLISLDLARGRLRTILRLILVLC